MFKQVFALISADNAYCGALLNKVELHPNRVIGV